MRTFDRRRSMLAVTTLVAVAVVSAVLGQQTARPSGSPPPSADGRSHTARWSDLTLEPFEPPATLIATHPDGAAVAVDTAFTVQSTGGMPAVELAARLRTSPPLAFSIEPGASTDVAIVRPTTALRPGETYRVTLAGEAGTVAASWAFQAASPLRVVATVPDDRTSGVPVDSGIELTFDEDGVIDAEARFSIVPAVSGEFETHGRTLVFVPESLAPATTYTVTLSKGVAIAGSSQVLESDVQFTFETDNPGAARDTTAVETQRQIVEAGTGQTPVLALSVYDDPDDATPAPGVLPVRIHHLSSVDAAETAIRTLAEAPTWASWSTNGLVETDSLDLVAEFDAKLEPVSPEPDSEAMVIRLPDGLDAGWYVVTIPRAQRDIQAILQVTDLAAYAMTTTSDTIVWIHDVGTGDPVRDAEVATGHGPLARTGADGLARFETATTAPTVLRVSHRGRTVLVPLLSMRTGSAYPWLFDRDASGNEQDRYWLVFSTDRTVYRSTDEVNAWGIVRRRDEGTVPERVELRVVRHPDDGGDRSATIEPPPVAVVSAKPDASGAFAAPLALRSVPTGGYGLELWVDGRHIADQTFSIDVIRKPAYEIDLTTDRHVLLAGERVTVTAAARFFEGTPVAGVELAAGAFDRPEVRSATDREGKATFRLTSGIDSESIGWEYRDVSVSPARPEEGEVGASAGVVVFPSAFHVDGHGEVDGVGVRFEGLVSEVDVARLEREWTSSRELHDPAGRPVPGAALTVRLVEQDWVRKVTGRRYDFIQKRTVDAVQYELVEREVVTKRVRTDASGRFSLRFDAARQGRDYVAHVSTDDGEGRTARAVILAQRADVPSREPFVRPVLEGASICSAGPSGLFSSGERIELTMSDADGPLPERTGSFLFIAAQRGLRDVSVSSTPELRRSFSPADVPGVTLHSVWFTGAGNVPSASTYRALFDPAERGLEVSLSTDRPRYRPGESAAITIRTADRTGTPVPASVVVRAIDEKLYSLGAAGEVDVLGELYRPVDDGILRSYASHAPVFPSGGDGCGDTTGGGRDDFRDSLLFRRITTDAQGEASLLVPLSDDLTSWRLTATAVDGEMRAGRGQVSVPVGLPFFVEATVAPEYVVADRPAIRLRAFGSDVSRGDPVRFEVSSPTLALSTQKLEGRAFEAIDVPLPTLSPGRHEVTIVATSGSGSDARTDRLTRTFLVVPSRLATTRSVGWMLGESEPDLPTADDALTTYVFADAGRGRLVPTLQRIAGAGGPRVDQSLASALAKDILVSSFGHDPDTLPTTDFDPTRYQRSDEGVALLPYSSPDLELTARMAELAGDRFNVDLLESALRAWRDDPAATRERRILAMAGLASIGLPVLPDLRAAAQQDDLTVRERLHLALGFAALGDDEAARSIERSLLEAHGERLGTWVRLRIEDGAEATAEATGLLAVVAAAIGDPIALEAAAYLEANPAVDQLHDIHLVAVAGRMLGRLAGDPSRFAYTVGGTREVVTLAPGESRSLTLTPEQVSGLVLEALEGRVLVTAARRVASPALAAARSDGYSLERSIEPDGVLGDDRLVRVTLRLRLPDQAPSGCYAVTDLVPSGLAPVTGPAGWRDAEAEPPRTVGPDSVAGQVVRFCVSADRGTGQPPPMQYVARVVTTGRYAWEPGIVQSATVPDVLAATSGSSVEIVAR